METTVNEIDAEQIRVGQPWTARFKNGYRCIAVKRHKPKVDDIQEWVVVSEDGRSHIGDLPEGLQLVAPISGKAPVRPRTPMRNFRITDAVYLPAQEVAAAQGETVTDVVVRSLILYTERATRPVS